MRKSLSAHEDMIRWRREAQMVVDQTAEMAESVLFMCQGDKDRADGIQVMM